MAVEIVGLPYVKADLNRGVGGCQLVHDVLSRALSRGLWPKKIKEGYGQCPLPALPTGQIETAVVDQLRALLRHPDVIARTYREVRKAGATAPDAAAVNWPLGSDI